MMIRFHTVPQESKKQKAVRHVSTNVATILDDSHKIVQSDIRTTSLILRTPNGRRHFAVFFFVCLYFFALISSLSLYETMSKAT